jgi:hypothetical protein
MRRKDGGCGFGIQRGEDLEPGGPIERVASSIGVER